MPKMTNIKENGEKLPLNIKVSLIVKLIVPITGFKHWNLEVVDEELDALVEGTGLGY